MKTRASRQLIGLLITLFLVVQPVFAFALAMPFNPASSMTAVSDQETSHSHALGMHAAEHVDMASGMACGELSQQECSVSSSGACSGLLSALVSQDLIAPRPLVSDQVPSASNHCYFSVVLDSLTPPPDSHAS